MLDLLPGHFDRLQFQLILWIVLTDFFVNSPDAWVASVDMLMLCPFPVDPADGLMFLHGGHFAEFLL